jgi:ParB-like chromosome segregation protein Spo0J
VAAQPWRDFVDRDRLDVQHVRFGGGMSMTELQIDPELKAWIDPLSTDEYALLEASILQDGCRDPLVIWAGYLLDGHNRYEICQKHGIEFSTFEKAGLSTKVDVKIWMIQNQMGKRNATDFARTALALKLKPLLEQRARERQSTSTGGAAPQLRLNSDEAGNRTDESIAKLAGVGRDTVRKVEKIIEKATAEVIEQVRTGEISINAAAKTVAPAKPVLTQAGGEGEPGTLEARVDARSTAGGEHDVSAQSGRADPDDGAADLVRLAEELQKENEAYQRQIKSLEADDKNAELVRLNTYADQLNGRLQGEITTRNEAQKMVKHYAGLLAKICKALNVESNKDILSALERK